MAARDLFGGLVALVSPRAAYERTAWRQAYDALNTLGERRYAAAAQERMTSNWRADGGSADAELLGDLALLRNRQRQMRRDDTYAAAIGRVYVTGLVGDGITAQAVHADESVASQAQDIWDAWASSKVDGRDDFYGVQKSAVSGMIDGETLIAWEAVDGQPDAGLRVLEGDYLDWHKNLRLTDGGKIVQGVEYDAKGRRVAYWLYRNHPGDIFGWTGGPLGVSERVSAIDIDHMFEALRPGQTRGVPWMYAALRKLRDVSDVEESIRIKKRVEACLSVFRKPGDISTGSPLGERTAQPNTSAWETLRPGMIIQGQPGEDISVINPSQSGDGDGFLRSQKMAAAAAAGVPYHLVTGDVSAANYSGLRADIVPFYQRLDDITFNVIVPHLCDSAFLRQMRRAAITLRKPELAKVTAEWTPSPRPWVDPLKEMTAEKMEMRSIPGEFVRAMTRRGLNWRKEIALQAQVNALLDKNRIAMDSDPRRIDGLGAIQPPASYLSATGAGPAEEELAGQRPN